MGKPPSKRQSTSQSTEELDDNSLEAVIDRQIGDIVSQKQREVIVAKMTSLMVSEHFSGPIPHPKHVRGYEEISPGAADRIIRMAEVRQAHHMDMDKKILAAEVADRKLGMWLGAAAFVFLVACALVTALITDSEVIPGLFLGAAAIGGVGLFIRGRQNNG